MDKPIAMGHQPNYLPYLGFFDKVAKCDKFVIVDHVQYVKRGTFGWMHRNQIKTPNGPIWLSVPILSKHKYQQKICDARINNNIPWRRKHWRSIKLNYQKAPHFKKYSDFFEDLYSKDWYYLVDISEAIIKYVIKELGINVEVYRSSKMDYKFISEGTGVIIDLCKALNTDIYLSGIHGKDYLDFELLAQHNIKVLYQNYKHPVYNQLYGEFIPHMSIIDLLFNEGVKSLEIITKNQNLQEL